MVLLIATSAFGADRDEFRRSIFEENTTEVLIQQGQVGSGHAVEIFDGTVAGGTLIYRLYLSGALAQIEAIHGLYLNYTIAGGIGNGAAILGMAEVSDTPTTPIANMGYFLIKDEGGESTPYWLSDGGTLYNLVLGEGSGDGLLQTDLNTEAKLETHVTDVNDIYTDNDGDPIFETELDTLAKLQTQIADNTIVAIDSAETLNFGEASLEMPNVAGIPTFTAEGQFGWDTVTKTYYVYDGVEAVALGGGSETLNQLHINYVLPATAFSEFGAVDIELDVSSLAATSEVHGVNIAAVGSTSGKMVGIGTHPGIDPIHQHVGIYVAGDQSTPDADQGVIPSGGSWADALTGATVFVADDDEIYIKAADDDVFSELEVILTTPASLNRVLVFEYQHTDTTWDAFVPLDGTENFTQSGIIEWNSDNLTNWKSDSDPGGADGEEGYWIRVRRTANPSGTTPIITTIKTLQPITYEWSKTGKVQVLSVEADLYDADGAVDLDIGSADVTDVTVTTDDGTIILDGFISSTGTVYAAVGFDALGAVDLDIGSTDVLDITLITDGGSLIIDGGITTPAASVVDMGASTSLEIPNSTDPDVTAEGMISYDTDDTSLRTYNAALTKQTVLGQGDGMKAMFTIISPLDLPDAATTVVFVNSTTFTFNITSIISSSDTNNVVYTLKESNGTDFTDLTVIEAITIDSSGTGMFFDVINAVDIDHTEIEVGGFILFDNDATDDPGWINVGIKGYYDADVD